MRIITMFMALLALSACGLFGGGSKPDTGTGGSGGGSSAGTFHPGPYTDEATGKSCGAPGGYCDDDKSCHSSADKCKKQ